MEEHSRTGATGGDRSRQESMSMTLAYYLVLLGMPVSVFASAGGTRQEPCLWSRIYLVRIMPVR